VKVSLNHSLANELSRAIGVQNVELAVENIAAEVRALASGHGLASWIDRAFRLSVSQVLVTDLGSVDGRLRTVPSNRRIVELSCRRPRTRQLFSLAHELSHLAMERHVPAIGADLKYRSLFHSDFDREEEKLADLLAAVMLMPTQMVQEIRSEFNDQLTASVQLAQRTQVSFSAAAIRVSDVCRENFVLLEFKVVEKGEAIVLNGGPLGITPLGLSGGWKARYRLGSPDVFPLKQTVRRTIQVESFPGVIEQHEGLFRAVSHQRVLAVFPKMKIDEDNRKFTKDGQDPFASVKWTKRSSKISNPDGSSSSR
jgi:Zn-dependent peptidase ImmA (M78 family)